MRFKVGDKVVLKNDFIIVTISDVQNDYYRVEEDGLHYSDKDVELWEKSIDPLNVNKESLMEIISLMHYVHWEPFQTGQKWCSCGTVNHLLDEKEERYLHHLDMVYKEVEDLKDLVGNYRDVLLEMLGYFKPRIESTKYIKAKLLIKNLYYENNQLYQEFI